MPPLKRILKVCFLFLFDPKSKNIYKGLQNIAISTDAENPLQQVCKKQIKQFDNVAFLIPTF